MTKKIDDLRARLFSTIDQLMDQDRPLDIARAKAIADVAQVIINSAKVEVEHLRVTGGDANPFLDPPDRKPARDRGVLSITQHRIK